MIGPNGARKTALLDVISGIAKPRSGRVMLGHTLNLTKRSEAEIAEAGVRPALARGPFRRAAGL